MDKGREGRGMKILRTAVIGLGRIGWRFHVPNVAQHDGFHLVAVVDPLQERLDEAKSEFDAKGYKSIEHLWDAEELDLVVIASPTHFHLEHAIAAFEHGCNVFCDKPMASSLADADCIIASMKEHDRKFMIYQPHRVRSETVALRAILSKNLIGDVYMIKRSVTGYDRRNDWQAFRKYGGGMLNNYGAHYIDQSLYISGSSARRISCSLRTIASMGDADDVVKAVIETESGVILDIDINMAAAYSFPSWQVLGKYGSLMLDEKERAWKARFFHPDELAMLEAQDKLAAEDRRYGSGEKIPWKEEVFPLSDFQPIDFYQKCYQYFALDEEPFVPVEETREVMRVLDTCRKDAGME
jgi:predicted dehydrogenase